MKKSSLILAITSLCIAGTFSPLQVRAEESINQPIKDNTTISSKTSEDSQELLNQALEKVNAAKTEYQNFQAQVNKAKQDVDQAYSIMNEKQKSFNEIDTQLNDLLAELERIEPIIKEWEDTKAQLDECTDPVLKEQLQERYDELYQKLGAGDFNEYINGKGVLPMYQGQHKLRLEELNEAKDDYNNKNETYKSILSQSNQLKSKWDDAQKEYDKLLAELIKFSDVPVSAWFYDAVNYVNDKGIMTGMREGYFGATSILSRAQFATILYRMSGSEPVEYEKKYPDVPQGTFYTDAVMWASKNGIITGYTEGPTAGRFGASDSITREQMAVMMYRYAKFMGVDTSYIEDVSTFPDGKKTSEFAREALGWAVGAGLITGNADGTLAPQGTASRAVCATIMMRYMQRQGS